MSEKIYVWDPLVRISHWSLVLSFIVCYLTGEEEDLIHAWSGYVILGLIAFRFIWGLIGSKHARFSDFIYSPANTIIYLKDMFVGKVKHYVGHNPAGGWMVMALLISLLLTSVSGLKVYGIEGYGPMASNSMVIEKPSMMMVDYQFEKVDDDDDRDHDGKEGEDFWEEIHEFLANFTVLLIALHITGVIVSSIKEHQNLIRAMITGYKEK
ncbi:MAG: cytochrome b/b6 domain-containing protein [Gammaproteobacteria bacterium]|nr:cytochrome b/b6 domain-containing protein [Gammaproteobacteria bacterium]